MAIRTEGLLQKTFVAGAAVSPYRIVKPGATDANVVQGAAATDKLIGVGDSLGASSGETFDVILDGIALVKAGGTIAFGDPITSDATGQAVASTTQGNRVVGYAMESAVAGDLVGVRIAPSTL
jgi:hypothetical protein